MAADAVYNEPMLARPIVKGMVGTIALLAVYFTVVSLISGWGFALDQFTAFWYFIISLAVGFGIQVGLFTYLKERRTPVPLRERLWRYRAPLRLLR